MNGFCPNCQDLTEIEIKRGKEEINVKNEKIIIDGIYSFCRKCNQEFSTIEQEEENLVTAYAIYRAKMNLLSPQDIKKLRNKYSLSGRQLARLLGWSEAIISQYENGRIPDRAHNDLLVLIHDPRAMLNLLHANSKQLSEKDRRQITPKICKTACDERVFFDSDLDNIKKNHFDYEADEYSGNSLANLQKFVNLILYIVKNMNSVFLTKLNKIPFYADFLHHREYGYSITGMKYLRHNHGPVPIQYEKIFTLMENAKLLKVVEKEQGNFTGKEYSILEEPDMGMFSENELKVLDTVIIKFKSYNAHKTRDYSHNEIAYNATEKYHTISYNHASTLSLKL